MFETLPTASDDTPPDFEGLDGAQLIETGAACRPGVELHWGEARDDASPRMRYRVHGSMDPDFEPDASTLLGETSLTSFRLSEAEAELTSYLVRAIDVAGNEDSNLRRLPARAPVPLVEPELMMEDIGPGALHVDVTPEPGRDGQLRLYRDDVLVTPDLELPAHVAGSGEYRVELTDCSGSVTSSRRTLEDTLDGYGLPALGVLSELLGSVESTDCSTGGNVQVFSGPPHWPVSDTELWVDGRLVSEEPDWPYHSLELPLGEHSFFIRWAPRPDYGHWWYSNIIVADIVDVPSVTRHARILGLEDLDPCGPSLVELHLAEADFRHGGQLELWRNGEPLLVPANHLDTFPDLPGEHEYVLRSVPDGCGETLEHRRTFTHHPGVLPEPWLFVVELDPCEVGRAEVRYLNAELPSGGRRELWRDGMILFDDIASGVVIDLPDMEEHVYALRLVDDDCGLVSPSELVTFQGSCSRLSPPVLDVGTSGSVVMTPPDAPPDGWLPTTHHVDVGSLASLQAGVYDHRRDWPGLRCPSSPTPTTGCDCGDGTTELSIELPDGDLYWLLTAANDSGEGSRGDDSTGRRRPGETCP